MGYTSTTHQIGDVCDLDCVVDDLFARGVFAELKLKGRKGGKCEPLED